MVPELIIWAKTSGNLVRTRSRAHAKCVCAVIIYCHCSFCFCCRYRFKLIRCVKGSLDIFILTNLTSMQLRQYIFYIWATKSNTFFMVNELDFIKFTNQPRNPKKNFIGFIHPFISPEELMRNCTEFCAFFFSSYIAIIVKMNGKLDIFPNYIKNLK